ncbi:MAG: CRISPR-associated helicase Cas3' [Cytophagales bacterium]|nr:CRISPR-associated helicase Cas3' [Cytophagales bacterium]
MDEVLAKSEPKLSVIQHTMEALDCLKKVLHWKQPLIDKICDIHQLNKHRVLRNIFLTVAFHDAGKANDEFQKKIRKQPFEKESHALFSVPFIYHYTKEKPSVVIDEVPYYPETLAVVSHHSKLHKHLFSDFNRIKAKYKAWYYPSFIEAINEKAKEFELEDWEDLIYDDSIIKQHPFYTFYDNTFDNVDFKEELFDNPKKIRDVFILFKSLLHYADWLSSGSYHDYGYSTSHNYGSITHRMKALYPERFEKWSDFQNKTARVKGNVFVQIPTGQGKTEASLLWAVNQEKPQKIIYLLPTMVTTNKMWRRLKNFFGIEQTGLSHSTANYLLKKDDEIEPQRLRVHYLYNRSFFKHVTIATIDQLLSSFLNWGHWVMTNAAIYNARIIIDEIHIYDGYTLGILLKVLELVEPYNTQFAIMSASLPIVLQEEIEKILPKETFTFINDEVLDEKQRHLLETRNVQLEKCIDDILNDYKSGKKVLIVCNTIKKARQLFDLVYKEELKNDIMLYHSQFILKDKVAKEKELEKIGSKKVGFIAICTQIVEVSLDIDFDVLYTENAPIDAIVQRLGRVNRKGEIQNRTGELFAKVVISEASETARNYIYPPAILDGTFNLLTDFIENLNGNLKEKHFKKIINQVYQKDNIPHSYWDDMNEGKMLVEKAWKECTKNIYTLSMIDKTAEKIFTRKSTYITVECILEKHYNDNDFESWIEEFQFDKIREYTVRVPIYLARKHKIKGFENSDLWLINPSYEYMQGISWDRDELNFY